MKGYIKMRAWIMDQLRLSLSSSLTYHDVEHTLGVLKSCNSAIKRGKIKGDDAKLLRIGALAHDVGFIWSMEDHEKVGAQKTVEKMAELGFSEEHQNIVKALILSTKVPQNPVSNLEKILCDADLDYLGGSFYYEISDKLFQELKVRKIISTSEQWLRIQISFLRSHRYHTNFALRNRNSRKLTRLDELEERLQKTIQNI